MKFPLNHFIPFGTTKMFRCCVTNGCHNVEERKRPTTVRRVILFIIGTCLQCFRNSVPNCCGNGRNMYVKNCTYRVKNKGSEYVAAVVPRI